MKDLLGREVEVGNYICYALTAGRSANLAVYLVREVLENKIKATKIDESCSFHAFHTLADGKQVPWKYTKVKYNPEYERVEMTEEEKIKVDSKTTTLSMSNRIFILDNFYQSLFEGKLLT